MGLVEYKAQSALYGIDPFKHENGRVKTYYTLKADLATSRTKPVTLLKPLVGASHT